MKSIKHFLLITLLIAATSVASVIIYWSYRQATHEVEELFDAELAQMARVLQSLLQSQLKRTQITQLQESLKYQPFITPQHYVEGQEATSFGHKYEKKLTFQVWNTQGQELLSSDSDIEGSIFIPKIGFNREQIGDDIWRTFMLRDLQLNIWIKVAQRSDVRGELTKEIVLSNLLPLVAMVPLLGCLIWLIIRRGLAPLHELSREIAKRGPDRLVALKDSGVPAEVRPVVYATNELMTSLDNALERERRFTADAAHELRTPLAGIRIHAQNLLLKSQPLERKETTDSIIQGVDSMTHVVEQLLTLSRLEHDNSIEKSQCAIVPLCRQECAVISPMAQHKKIELALQCHPSTEQTQIHGNPQSLAILIRNLLHNAILYTPENGMVQISIYKDNQSCILVVEDTGPGIPESLRESAFERFQRLGQQQVGGSGVGLAIVREIAEQHQAEIKLLDSEMNTDGLRVQITFPL